MATNAAMAACLAEDMDIDAEHARLGNIHGEVWGDVTDAVLLGTITGAPTKSHPQRRGDHELVSWQIRAVN